MIRETPGGALAQLGMYGYVVWETNCQSCLSPFGADMRLVSCRLASRIERLLLLWLRSFDACYFTRRLRASRETVSTVVVHLLAQGAYVKISSHGTTPGR